MKGNPVLCKFLVIGVIVLFIGMSVVSSSGNIVDNIPSYTQNHNTENSVEDLMFRGNYGYAYNAYPGPEGTVYFTLDNLSVLWGCGETITADFLQGGAIDGNGIWYATEYGSGVLYGIDIHNGCEMWTIGGRGSLYDLAWDDCTSTLYGTSGYNFYEIDTKDGGRIFTGSSYILFKGIAFNSNCICYAVGYNGSVHNLYIINFSSFDVTFVAPLTNISSFYYCSLEFDKDNDVLYLLIHNDLFTCDTDTGVCTVVYDDGYKGNHPELTAFVIPYEYEYKSNTLYVGGSGEGNYTTIQDAINDSKDGDTVFVYDESSPYYEGLIINKSINLIGEDKNTTVINGFINKWINCINPHFETFSVLIVSSNVFLCGFTIQKPTGVNVPTGIFILEGNKSIITNNIIIDGYYWGIRIDSDSLYNVQRQIVVSNNIIENCDNGLYLLYMSGSTITNNIIRNCVMDDAWGGGIDIYRISNSIISNNEITNNINALSMISSEKIKIFLNNVTNNVRGIRIEKSDDVEITNNNIYSNRRGLILIEYANQNTYINGNYWGKPLNYLKIIIGIKKFYLFTWETGYMWPDIPIYLPIPKIRCDWHPAKEPYDIEV